MPVAPRTSEMDGFSDMARISQTVKKASSPNFHTLCIAAPDDGEHNAAMSESDKNGGPNHIEACREYRVMSQT